MCSLTTKGKVPDSAVPKRNDTYTLYKYQHCIEDQEETDFETESSILENEESTEELQDEIGVSQNEVVLNPCTETQQHKCQNSKERICNATFVIDSHEVHPPTSLQGLSDIYKKPVSVVQPLVSSVAKSSDDCSKDTETSRDSEYNLVLVKAVLCSRNKIARALAGITQDKQPRSSQVCSEEVTHQTFGELRSTSKTGLESRSTSQTGRELSYPFTGENSDNKTKDRHDLICKEQNKATVTQRLLLEFDNKGTKVLDQEKCQPMCPSEDSPGPFVRCQSVKIIPTSLEYKTRSPPKSLKLENCNFDKPRVNSPSTKRRSTTLCKLSEPVGSTGQGANHQGCQVDSLTTTPASRALGTLSSHRTTPLLQCPTSPAQPLSLKTMRRRSSQILRANKDGLSTDSKSTVEKKEACLEHLRDPVRKCQILLKDGSIDKRYNSPVHLWPTEKRGSGESSKNMAAGASFSKKSVICRIENVHVMSQGNLVAKRTSSSHPASPTQQKLNVSLEWSEAVTEKSKACKEEHDCIPVVIRNRQDHKLLCTKSSVDLEIRNSGMKEKEKACKEKHRFNNCSSEMKSREVCRLSSTKANVDVLAANSGAIFVTSQKNLSDDHGYVVSNARRSNEMIDEINNDKLNWRWKIPEVGSPLGIHANKGGLSIDRAVRLLCKKDLELKEKGARTVKVCAASPSESTRNSIVLSHDLNRSSSPSGSQMRKRRAGESIAMDLPDSLPRKQPKRSSTLSSYLEHDLSSFHGSQSPSWQGRQSTPMKGKNIKRLRMEGFSPQNMELLSPIRRPALEHCDSVQGALASPCKGLVACDKSFCFQCS